MAIHRIWGYAVRFKKILLICRFIFRSSVDIFATIHYPIALINSRYIYPGHVEPVDCDD